MEEAWQLEGTLDRRATPVDDLERLASASQQGDRAAFEQIYFALVDDLYTYARGHSLTDADAEDIVANTFLKAWQRARRYQPDRGDYRRWIFGIARNEMRDYWRARRQTPTMPDGMDLVNLAAPASSADPSLPGAVVRALSLLTPDQRDVIALRYFAGKTPTEIAQLLGKREGSVRSLQHRALEQLRKAVRDASPRH